MQLNFSQLDSNISLLTEWSFTTHLKRFWGWAYVPVYPTRSRGLFELSSPDNVPPILSSEHSKTGTVWRISFQRIVTLSFLSFSHFKQLSEGCGRSVYWWSAPINLWYVPSVFSEGHFLRVFFLHIFKILQDLFKSSNTSLWVQKPDLCQTTLLLHFFLRCISSCSLYSNSDVLLPEGHGSRPA